MGASERFDRYMNHLAEGLGHLDRHAGADGDWLVSLKKVRRPKEDFVTEVA